MKQQIFPLCIIALNIGAAVVYALSKDWRKSIYFLLAAALNAVVM